MAEREVVALVTRDRNPSVTPADIQPNIGWVARSVERLSEAPEALARIVHQADREHGVYCFESTPWAGRTDGDRDCSLSCPVFGTIRLRILRDPP